MVFVYHKVFLEMVVKNTAKTLAGVFILSLIVLWSYRTFVPKNMLLLWALAQTILIVARFFNSKTLGRHLKRNSLRRAHTQIAFFLVLIICSALLWNLILIGGTFYAPPSYEYFSFIIAMGLITGAIMSLSPVIHIYFVYFSLLLVPQLIFFIWHNGGAHIAVLLGSIVFIPYVLTLSMQSHKNLAATVLASERLRDSVDELHEITITDPLTGVYNRRYFFAISQNLIDLSMREKKDVSLLMLDIDYFKKINDTYGHQAGDEVLKQLSAEIDSMVRKSDVFARIGGEEFGLLLYGASRENSIRIAQKICIIIEEKSFLFDEVLIPVTLSIGLAALDEQMNTLDLLFKQADVNLYKAKDSGRNCCVS